MKIIICAFDIPFPANRGGRADVWRRIVALHELGFKIYLICWLTPTADEPSNPELEHIHKYVQKLVYFRTRQGLLEALTRLVYLPVAPSHASSRRLSTLEFNTLIESTKNFNADLVWIEGPYPALTGKKIAKKLNIPYVYRSHNIEYLYMKRQANAAKNIRDKFAWYIASLGLKKFEFSAIHGSISFFDVSADDLQFWKMQGLTNGKWLPPLSEATLNIDRILAVNSPEVVFIGNLTTPNNIRGVEWLVNEIIPLVLKQRPETTFLIAGSNPSESLKMLCSKQSKLTLIANPEKVLPYYHSAKVLVNPVRTGSGIHVKALDMLMTDAPIVSSVQGTCGMPEEVKRLFLVSDETTIFAQFIIDSLKHPHVDLAAREHARRFFTVTGLAEAFQLLNEKTIE